MNAALRALRALRIVLGMAVLPAGVYRDAVATTIERDRLTVDIAVLSGESPAWLYAELAALSSGHPYTFEEYAESLRYALTEPTSPYKTARAWMEDVKR